MSWLTNALELVAAGRPCVLVTVLQVKGSAPREAGAKMLVHPEGTVETIGGGRLEYEAVRVARRILTSGRPEDVAFETFALGPELDQCCGGAVQLLFEGLAEPARPWLRTWAEMLAAETPFSIVRRVDGQTVTRRMLDAGQVESSELPPFVQGRIRQQLAGSRAVYITTTAGDGRYIVECGWAPVDRLYLFGAGHVGKAIVRAFEPLPFHITWIDGRAGVFPRDVPRGVVLRSPRHPPNQVDHAPPQTFFLVMTHSHPLDLEICSRVLQRDDFGFLGLIGSDTKRARFASRLRAIGIPAHAIGRLTCPIGVPGIDDKEPAAIAAAVAAQLLIVSSGRRRAAAAPPLAALETGT